MAKASPIKVLVTFINTLSWGWIQVQQEAVILPKPRHRVRIWFQLRRGCLARDRAMEATTQRCHRKLKEIKNYPGFFLLPPLL